MWPRLQLLFALSTATVDAGWSPPSRVETVILVHGIWEDEHRAFPGLRAELESRGVRCIVPSLKPATAITGISTLARQLDSAVRLALPGDERYIVIGYSMGGLVSRVWLQNLGGADHCDAFITISTPHHGTRMAHAHPGLGAAEMRPGSVFLSSLAETESVLNPLPLLSYRTPWDGIIVPSESSIWPLATNVEIPCLFHARMTSHPALLADLTHRLGLPEPTIPPAKARPVFSKLGSFPK